MEYLGSHILSVEQFDIPALELLFEVTDRMLPYARRERVTSVLDGAVLCNMFFEPSTRSRLSFGSAFNRLGGYVRDTTGFAFSSIAKGESLYDTARVVAGYSDVLVMRHPEKGSVAELAGPINVPVINGGDGAGEHPTQALLDLYTLCRERSLRPGGLDGMTITFVGDLKYGRTVQSLSALLALERDLTFVCVAPEALAMPAELVQRLRDRGHEVILTEDIVEGARAADVIYTTRVQEERIPNDSEVTWNPVNWRVDAALYDKVCRPGTVLMHPLPRDSRQGPSELSTDLNQRPELAIFRQADNGVPVRMALFALVLGVADHIDETSREARWFTPPQLGVDDTRPILG